MLEYLLDTNAYFTLLCYFSNKIDPISEADKNVIRNIIDSNCSISRVTLIEIISVIGKHSRGSSSCRNKCNHIISNKGECCKNHIHTQEKRKWKTKEVAAWLKLTKDITQERSPILKLDVIDFDKKIIDEAEKIIHHSLRYNFASMDSIITATAKCLADTGKNICVVTSDKSMIMAMKCTNMVYNDALKNIKYNPKKSNLSMT